MARSFSQPLKTGQQWIAGRTFATLHFRTLANAMRLVEPYKGIAHVCPRRSAPVVMDVACDSFIDVSRSTPQFGDAAPCDISLQAPLIMFLHPEVVVSTVYVPTV